VIVDQIFEAVGERVEQARAAAAAVAVSGLLGLLFIGHEVTGLLSMRIVRILRSTLCGTDFDLRYAVRSVRRRRGRFAGFAAFASPGRNLSDRAQRR
jgi:hypothetical protein